MPSTCLLWPFRWFRFLPQAHGIIGSGLSFCTWEPGASSGSQLLQVAGFRFPGGVGRRSALPHRPGVGGSIPTFTFPLAFRGAPTSLTVTRQVPRQSRRSVHFRGLSCSLSNMGRWSALPCCWGGGGLLSISAVSIAFRGPRDAPVVPPGVPTSVLGSAAVSRGFRLLGGVGRRSALPHFQGAGGPATIPACDPIFSCCRVRVRFVRRRVPDPLVAILHLRRPILAVRSFG